MSIAWLVLAVLLILGFVTDWFETWFGGLRDELVRGMKIRNDLKEAEARLKKAEADKAEAEANRIRSGQQPEECSLLRRQAD